MSRQETYRLRVVEATAGYFEQAGRAGAPKSRNEHKKYRGSAILPQQGRTAREVESISVWEEL